MDKVQSALKKYEALFYDKGNGRRRPMFMIFTRVILFEVSV